VARKWEEEGHDMPEDVEEYLAFLRSSAAFDLHHCDPEDRPAFEELVADLDDVMLDDPRPEPRS
jgi:hypothetical protein